MVIPPESKYLVNPNKNNILSHYSFAIIINQNESLSHSEIFPNKYIFTNELLYDLYHKLQVGRK